MRKFRIRPVDWVAAGYTIFVALLLGIAKIAPQMELFSFTIGGQSLCLLLLSVWALFVLVWMMLKVQQTCDIRLTKQNVAVLLAAILVTAGYYLYSLTTRRFAYYWDYTVYYRMQLGLADNFRYSGFLTPVLNVIGSVWYEEYSTFNSVFIAAPFAFTPHTANWFIASSAAVILPLLYWAIAIVIKLIERMARPTHSGVFFGGSMLVAAGLPLMHRALLYGQPDLFGLILVFLIVALTVSCDFSKTEIGRCLLIVVLTAMTCASRRWYMFWLLGYYACYAVVLVVSALIQKKYKNIARLVLFGVCAAAAVGAVLFPMFRRVLGVDYIGSYTYYNTGGLPAELQAQAQYLGIGLLLLIAFGGVWALLQKSLRQAGILAISSGGLILFLFTRVQNMGYHQSLILVPSYILLMVFCIAGVCGLKKRAVFACVAAAVLGFSAANTVVCAASERDAVTPTFSDIPLKLAKRNDFEAIERVNQWLREHCSETDYAYMIPHGLPYNPDIFRCFDLPDESVLSVLQYGSAILGTQSFPLGLLSAKYVLTCDPFCNASIAEQYNAAFLSEIPQKHFEEVQTFDMGNGYTFTVYERVQPADAEEIAFYKGCFAEEDALFPEMFSGVLDEALAELNAPGS